MANAAGPLEECEVDGTTTFDLTTLESTISGGSGAVTWFSNAGLTNQIFNTTTYTGNSPVYAIVNINGCSSMAVQVDLISLPEPNADANILGTIECLGSDLDLDEAGGDAVSWDWSGPNFSSSAQFPTVTAAEAGTYIVTVTDANGCTNSDQVDYFPPSGPTIVWDLGSETVCSGDCVALPFTITGGTPPYTIDIFGSAGIPFLDETCQYTIAAGVNSIDLCLNGSGFGVDCDNAGGAFTVPPIVTTLVSTGFFEITYIEDANGCIGVPNPGVMTVTLGAPENPVDPGPLEVCGQTGTDVDFDIAALEGTIGGANTVLWYSDAGLTMPITGSPYTVNMNTTIYAVVDNGDCPSDAIAIQLNIVDAPNAGEDALLNVCTNDSDPLDLFAALGTNAAAGGTWMDDDGAGVNLANAMAVNFVGVTSGTYDFTYMISGNGGCADDTAIVTVNVNQSPMFSFFDDECINGNTEFTFTLNTGIDTDVLINIAGATISGSGSTYTFTIPAVLGTVVVTATDPTTQCSAEFSFEFMGCDCGVVTDPTNVDVTYCSNEAIPSIDAMIEAGLTANWYDDAGMLVFTGSPFNPTTPGVYFIEAVDADGCASNQIEIEVVEFPFLSIGTDNEVFVCSGADFDLTTALVGNDLIGQFTDTTAMGALNGTILNTSILVEGNSYLFTHSGFGTFVCEEEGSVDILVNIVSNVTAGPNVLDTLCSIQAYDLQGSLGLGSDLGGTFEDPNNTGTLVGSMFTPTFTGPYGFLYIVGGGACPTDTAEIIIDVHMEPTASLLTQINDICEGACAEIDFIYNSEQGTSYWEILDENGLVYLDTIILAPNMGSTIPLVICNNFNPTLLEFAILDPSHEYTINLTSIETVEGCVFDINESIELTTYGNDTLFIDQTLCSGSSITYGGVVFDENNPSDTLILSTIYNCDSTIAVNLNFTNFSELLVEGLQCFDYEIELNGITYNVVNPSGSDLIPGGSVFGCDSLITVNLSFTDNIIGSFTGPICNSETVTIGGTDFNMSNPNGTATIVGGSFQGCDSTVQVNLQFYDDGMNLIDDDLCAGQSLVIEGEVFDSDNPSGTVLIPGVSVFGCDSIITVDLNFSNAVSGTIDGFFCPDFSVTVNNQIYDIINPNGSEILPNASVAGCDSLVNIDLDFFPEAVEFSEFSLCPGSTVIVNGTEYGEDNQMGEEIIPNASSNGCDSIIMVSVTIDQQVNATLVDTLCPGESINLGGMIFDENTPSGQTVVNASSSTECDTLYMVDLVFDRGYDFTVLDACLGDEGVEVILESADILNLPLTIRNTGDGQTYTVNNLPFSFFVTLDTGSAEIQDANACVEQTVFQINVNTNPQLDAILGSIVGNAYNVSYTTNVSVDSVVWSPETLVDCVNCPSTVASSEDTQELYLEVYYGNDCVLRDTLIIEPLASTDIFIPSIFSANNDGENDVFFIQSESEYEINEFFIYDRWGNIVYNVNNGFTNDPSIGWEGDWDGKDLNPGIYVYYFVVEIPGRGEFTYSGDVTLLR